MTQVNEEDLYSYEILVLKLTSGDTVVSYADISDPDSIRLYRPLEVRWMTGQRSGHGLLPWMPFSESEVYNVHRKNIVVMETPIKVMIDGYISSCDMYDEEPTRYKYTEERNKEWEEEFGTEGIRFADQQSEQVYEAMLQRLANTHMKVH
tara:strand:+ start:493 stop:942 length:450 start_codon:yes stop_codon:yes gene_type:complete